LPPIFGLNGAWAVMPVSDGLSAIVSAGTFFWFYKKFKAETK
jgi:Na+-driven multidrug efflux pump